MEKGLKPTMLESCEVRDYTRKPLLSRDGTPGDQIKPKVRCCVALCYTMCHTLCYTIM